MEIRDNLRANLLEFSRKAFNILPPIESPSILDIGCGSGTQSIELAKMSNGHVTSTDIDIPALVFLQRKIKEQGLSDRFSILRVSMVDLHVLEKTYDIIWAEGSIYAIGFDRGLREWKQLLKKPGFLVIHDEDTDIDRKFQMIEKYGYKVIGKIEVSHEEWEERYYKPLLNTLVTKKLDDTDVMQLRKEIDTFKRTKKGSMFFILRN